jgi:hypothetical protein
LIIAVVVLSVALVGTLILSGMQHSVNMFGSVNLSFSTLSVHVTASFWKDGVLLHSAYHAGAVTQLGLNVTFAKLLGAATFYNLTQYNLNVTYMSIGYNTSNLTPALTCLPNEWNRTAATPHDATYNSCNWTAVIHPDTGPYTAQCFGINFEGGIGNNALFAYDSYPTQVTGIDSTFTITLEFKVSGS